MLSSQRSQWAVVSRFQPKSQVPGSGGSSKGFLGGRRGRGAGPAG